jgi:uncharacterized protein
VTPVEWLAVALVGVGAVSQGVAGFGFGLVAASAVIAAFGPTAGVVSVCVLALLSTVVPLAREVRHTRWADAGIWIAAAVVVTPLLGWALRGVDTGPLSVASGVVILVGVGLLALGRSAASLGGRVGAVLAGGVSAAMNLVAGAGGPPVALYAANAGWTVAASRATMLTFFTASNLITIAVLGWDLPGAVPMAAMVVSVLSGTALAAWLSPRMGEGLARTLTLVIAAVGGASLVIVAWL